MQFDARSTNRRTTGESSLLVWLGAVATTGAGAGAGAATGAGAGAATGAGAVLVQARQQVQQQVQVQVQQFRAQALVRPPLHQPLQSQFQRQRFRLQQHESR
jgi:hypothetical protein